MRPIFSFIVLCAAVTTAIAPCQAQGWRYDERFKTDFLTSSVDREIEVVNCNTGSREMRAIGICMRQDVADGMRNPVVLQSHRVKTDGLYNKVSRGVAAARPNRTSSSSRFTANSMSEARKTGKNYNHSTSAAGRAWRAKMAAERQESIRREQERRRQEKIRKKIADDNRAAAVTAATNARLQGETNRRIQNDYYNANEGAYLAQQRARQAHRTVGPQFKRQETSSGSDRAKLLRRQNKPRRVMYPQRQPQNTVRKPLAQVERKQLSPEQEVMLKRALMVRAELRRKKAAEKKRDEYKGIKLSDSAVSTLGKDWSSDDFKTGPLAPPVHVRSQYKEPAWLTQHKDRLELLGQPPLTTDEELQLLKEHEIYSTL